MSRIFPFLSRDRRRERRAKRRATRAERREGKAERATEAQKSGDPAGHRPGMIFPG